MDTVRGNQTQANFTIATCNIQSLKNKELQVSELISDYSIDALVIQKPGLKLRMITGKTQHHSIGTI